MQQEGPPPVPSFGAVFERLCSQQETGQPLSLGQLLAELHDEMADVPEDKAAGCLLAILGMVEFGINPQVSAELQTRRQQLVAIITRERAAAAGQTRIIRIREDPDGPYVERTVQHGPSAALTAALRELEEIDARLPARE